VEFVDGGDLGKGNDWVCLVNVKGFDKNNQFVTDSDPAEPLGGGNFKIRND